MGKITEETPGEIKREPLEEILNENVIEIRVEKSRRYSDIRGGAS